MKKEKSKTTTKKEKKTYMIVQFFSEQWNYLMSVPDSGKTVCNDQHRPALHCSVDGLLNQVLTLGIQCARSLWDMR